MNVFRHLYYRIQTWSRALRETLYHLLGPRWARRVKRYVFWPLVDASVVLSSFALAWSARALTSSLLVRPALLFALVAIGIYCTTNGLFRLYHRIWLYASAGEIVIIGTATATGTALLNLTLLLWPGSRPVPVSVVLLTGLFAFVGFVTVRYRKRVWTGFPWRWHALWGKYPTSRQRVLIVGAGEAGQLLAWRLIHYKEGEQYEVVGFVDDDPEKHGLYIHGFKVLGDRHIIPEVVRRHRVDLIVLAMYNITSQDMEAILDICEQTPAIIKVLPDVFEFLSANNGALPIRHVTAEDLIGREPVRVDMEACRALIEGKVVLVTGAAGSIGSELCRQILGLNPRLLVALDNNESGLYDLMATCYLSYRTRGRGKHGLEEDLIPVVGDITHRERMAWLFRRYRPQIVFHAAAYKHVPLMEEQPQEAVRVNVLGTQVVAELAARYGVERFVFVSTDKAINPRSVMGATKRLCELMLIHRVFPEPLPGAPTLFTAVRFGNVLGSRGSVIPLFERQIDAGGPVTVTHPEMTRYFMVLSEAVSLIIQAATQTRGGDIFMLDMGRRVRIDDLARRLIRLRGLRPGVDIPIVYTGPRPGEKLHEELLGKNEERLPTEHPRIWRIVSRTGITPPSRAQIDTLLTMAESQKIEPMVALLWQMVSQGERVDVR